MQARTEPLSVMFVVNDAGFFVSHRLPIAKKICEEGGRVVLLSSNYSPTVKSQLSKFGIGAADFGLDRGKVNILKEIRAISQLRQSIKEYQPDLVHFVTIRSIFLGLFAYICQNDKHLSPRLFAFSGLGYLYISKSWKAAVFRFLFSKAMRYFHKKSDWVLVQNCDDMNTIEKERLVPRDRVRLIRGSGVDLQAFPFSPMPQSETIKVVMISRLLIDKGVIEFIEMASVLQDRQPHIEFLLVGDVDPSNPKSLSHADLMRRIGGIRHLQWLGPRKDVAEIYNHCHIACLPSYREGLPKSLLEALSVGRAILTTDVPGCREVVKEGWNSCLVEPKSASALVSGLLKLVDDPVLLHVMGERSRHMAERDFSVDAVVDQTLSLYQEILAG